MRNDKKGFIGLVLLFATLLAASEPKLVYDINPNGSSSPEDLTIFQDRIYFSALEDQHGRELWVYDGSNPPSLVYDICPGAGSSNPADMIVYNQKLYFGANDGISGHELWQYDGTNPPVLAYDISPGDASSTPANFCIYNNKLYFRASVPEYGQELWVYDGENPPARVADIASGTQSSVPANLFVYKSKLLFSAFTSTTGRELWSYDGINAPVLVADIFPGEGSSYPKFMTIYRDYLVFGASSKDANEDYLEIWLYDNVNPPQMVQDAASGKYLDEISMIQVLQDKLYIGGRDGGPYASLSTELWQCDLVTPPQIVKDLWPGKFGSRPHLMVELNSHLFVHTELGYSSQYPATIMRSFWMMDDSGDLIKRSNAGFNFGVDCKDFIIYNNKLYHNGFSSAGWELMEYDGQVDPSPFKGSFPGIGVWHMDGISQQWEKLCQDDARQLVGVDLDLDRTEDLLGWWDNPDGIWLRDGKTQSWQKILPAQHLIWLSAGDINAWGKVDIIGSWKSGIWWRDSDTGTWTRLLADPASMITTADLDWDRYADLIGAWPSGIWIYSSYDNKWKKILDSDNLIYLTSGDMNGDGIDDLVGSWTCGVWWMDMVSNQWTCLHPNPAQIISTLETDCDGKADLLGVWPGISGVWCRNSSDGTWKKLNDLSANAIMENKKKHMY